MKRILFIAFLLVAVPFFVGCAKVPIEVKIASQEVGMKMQDYRTDMIAYINAVTADYEVAIYQLTDIILDYEIEKAANAEQMVALATLQELMIQYRAKRAEMKQRIAATKEKIMRLDTTILQAISLQESLTQYICAQTLEIQDVRALIDKIKDTATGGE